MKSKHLVPIASAAVILVIASLACVGLGSPEPTPTPIPPIQVNTPVPPPTEKPTLAPEPTEAVPSAEPTEVAVQEDPEFQALLEKFKEKGYINSTEGDITTLEPFDESWAQLGWYQWWSYDFEVSDFLFKSHFKWSTANDTPEVSGCGVIFGLQENKNHYAVFLDKSRILFLMSRGSNVYEVGKYRGSGRTSFSNPAEADFAVAVKDRNAYVSVDGEFTEYQLSQDQTTQGKFALTLFSGTNRDYGTRCEMTDSVIWTPK